MLSRAARFVTSHGHVIRAFTECDTAALAPFIGIANSSEMTSQFQRFVNDSTFCGAICENKERKTMLMSTGHVVDDGATLVSNVRFRHPASPDSGHDAIEEKTRLFCVSEARKSMPSVERVAFSTNSLEPYQPAFQNGESPYRVVAQRMKGVFQIELANPSAEHDLEARTMPVKEFDRDWEASQFLSRVINNSSLFPQQRLVVEGDQYRLLESNVLDIVRKTSLITASFGNGKLGRCSGVSFGTVSFVDNDHVIYTLDFYGNHTTEAIDHVITHLSALKKRFSDQPQSCTLHFVSQSKRVDIESVKKSLSVCQLPADISPVFTLEVPFIGFLSKYEML